VLSQYDLAHKWDYNEASETWVRRVDGRGSPILQSSQPPEILFIERALQFLKPGTGMMAVVVPNGILNNTPLGYVRQWLVDNAQVLAVVDMQRDLFQPKNDTQTSMVILRRLSPDERGRNANYPILFVVTDRIGHDKRGKPIYKRDENGDDTLETRAVSVTVFENGVPSERLIEETGPVIDDQLPEVPTIFRSWREEHGL